MSLRHRIVRAFAIISLIACFATVGMWLRSESVAEVVMFHRQDRPDVRPYGNSGTYFISDDGGVILRRVNIWTTDPKQIAAILAAPMGPRYEAAVSPGEPRRQCNTFGEYLGFEWPVVTPGAPGQTANYWQARVPYWFIALLLVVLPACWLRRRAPWLRSRRIAAGLCPMCGYDVRASPDRCPECGSHVAHPV